MANVNLSILLKYAHKVHRTNRVTMSEALRLAWKNLTKLVNGVRTFVTNVNTLRNAIVIKLSDKATLIRVETIENGKSIYRNLWFPNSQIDLIAEFTINVSSYILNQKLNELKKLTNNNVTINTI